MTAGRGHAIQELRVTDTRGCDRGSGRVTAREQWIVYNRFREILYPLLVISIIGSLWIVGRTQEMEDEIRFGKGPTARWAALSEASHASTAD